VRRRQQAVGLGLALVLASCSTPTLQPIEPGAGFDIPEFRPGECRFDTRSQLTRFDDLDSPQKTWSVDVPWGFRPSLQVIDGVALLPTRDGIAAVDETTGNALWQRVDEDPTAIGQGEQSAWVFTVSAEASRATLDTIDVATGETVRIAESQVPTAIEIAHDGSRVYTNRDGAVTAIDLATGGTAWTLDAGGDPSFGPRLIDAVLYHQEYYLGVWAIDPATGARSWHWAPDDESGLSGEITATDRVVIVRTNADGPRGANTLVGLDRDSGEALWQFDLGNRADSADPSSTPLPLDGAIVVIGSQHSSEAASDPLPARITRLDDEGSALWSEDIGEIDLLWGHTGGFTNGDALVAFYRRLVSRGTFDETPNAWEWVIESREIATGLVMWSFTRPSPASVTGPTVAPGPDGDILVAWDAGGDTVDPDRGLLSRHDGATGELIWSLTTRDPIDADAVVIGADHLLVRSADREIGCE
jgi:outer membrane protein assembly factor BamB